MSAPVRLALPAGPPLVDLVGALQPHRRPVLLDSGPADEGGAGRWNLLVFDPIEVLEHRSAALPGPGVAERAFGRVEAALDAHWPERGHEPPPGPDEPPFRGGVVGAFAYDLGRELERLPATAHPDGDLPDMLAGVYPFALVEDRRDGRRWVVGRGSPDQARAFAAEVAALVPPPAGDGVVTGQRIAASSQRARSTFERAGFEAAVTRIREHILDGEVYQVNLAQRFEVSLESGRSSSAGLLRAVRSASPAPFGALLVTPGVEVLSNSPELFLRRRGEEVLSRPIKGTRPRGRCAEEDASLRAALEASPKERAELAMIVDLVRNDLGRSAVPGSISVDLPFVTDVRATVFHRQVDVRGRVSREVSSGALVEAAWPPASVTGTPKLSALGIIEALEPVRRHLYTGALGWFDAGGDLELSVGIRIVTRIGDRLLVPVGSGITLASDPSAEYDETLHKARAWFGVLGVDLPDEGVLP